MKARIKKTGEILEGFEFDGGFLSLEGGVRNAIHDIKDVEIMPDEPESTLFDWESFRNETAVKCLLKLLEKPNLNDKEKTEAPSISRWMADELIKQLKKVKE